jgi:ATP-binding cassette subfamily B protein
MKYVFMVLENEVGDNTGLPAFLINFFRSAKTPLMTILYVGICLYLYQILRCTIKVLYGYTRDLLGEKLHKDFRTVLYDHIQSLPYSYHNNVDTGDLIQRCTSDLDTVKGFISRQIPDILAIMGTVGGAAFQMVKINVQLMLVSMIIMPLMFGSSLVYFMFVRKKYTAIEKSEAKLTTMLQENLSGVRVVKAFANERFEYDRFYKQNDDYSRQNIQLNNVSSLFWGLGDFVITLQYLLSTWVAINLARTGDISLSDILVAFMLVGSFIWPIRGLGRIIGDMGKSVVSAGRIQEIIQKESEFKEDGTLTPIVDGKIEFRNVVFKFSDTDKNLLNGVSFAINPGETVAIMGKTGSGKSTVANLLTRLLDYQDGSILINGVELKEIKKKYIRKQIGLVLQDPFLFSKTIYENIAIANRNAGEEKIYTAAKIAAIDKDINGFEKGYQTMVGEKGTTLSGGQKQRVAIARMLVEDKPILIFDDSLSAVDTQTDLMIRNALNSKLTKTTTIIITHRITTAKQADKIVVLEDGKVSQIGTHETLSKTEGLYKKLWDIQGQLEAEFLKVLKEGSEN